MLTAVLCAVALVAPNTEQLQVSPPRQPTPIARRKLRPLTRKQFKRRIAKIGLPGPASVTVARESLPGTPDNFVETFHEAGRTDMFEAMRAYKEVGYTGPFRVDHVPTMEGEQQVSPGYETMGRLYAIGYAKGLIEGVNKLDGQTPHS